jgi:dipeptidyl aminopeptidase/acylaminoacyl peptidase
MQFSPDGKRIAYTSDRSGNYEIWVATGDGQTPVQLTNFGGALTGMPRWSPDGTQIAFDSRPEGHSSIYVIGVDGTIYAALQRTHMKMFCRVGPKTGTGSISAPAEQEIGKSGRSRPKVGAPCR